MHPRGVEPRRKEISLSLPPETGHLSNTAWDSNNLNKPSRLLDLSLDQHLPLFPESHSLLHQSIVNLGHQEGMGGGG